MWKNYALFLLVFSCLSFAFSSVKQREKSDLESVDRCAWLGLNSKGVIKESYVGPISLTWIISQLNLDRSVIYDCPPNKPRGVINKSHKP